VAEPELDPDADITLMRRIRDGDDRALGELYDRHGGLVFKVARAIVGGDADAEEVTMDAFLQVWRGAARFDPARGSARAWLATMARSRALDHVRSRERRHAVHARAAERGEDGVAVQVARAAPTDHRAMATEIRSELDRALAHLSVDQRRAIELAYFGGLSQSEIARRLGEPLGTVKTRIRDGMRSLRERLAIASGGSA
jgi:RNA polymerase sigma-70 factor (ECF subfamily)